MNESAKIADTMARAHAAHLARGGKPHVVAPAPVAKPLKDECIWRGAATGEKRVCQSCAGRVELNVFACQKNPEGCTIQKKQDGLACCDGCLDRVLPPPSWHQGVLTYDHTTLYPGLPGKRFNPSVIAWEGGYVFCWRDGWKGSDLWACRMGKDFRPVGDAVKLDIVHPDANYGREDPQLYVHDGQLEVALVGVLGHGGRVTQTHVLYAKLNADLTVSRVFAPKAPGVHPNQWQKNWQWFSWGGERYAVYSISPHRVLRVCGDWCGWLPDTQPPFQWPGGEMRGGASPVRVGDEYWCFFHDRVKGRAGRDQYRVGLYTFEAKPPFRVQRYIPHPILAADPLTQPAAERNYCDVLFPRGAVRDGADWVLSCGVHDRFTELHRLSAANLERQLLRITPPASFAWRTDPKEPDGDIFASVAGHDEYGLSRFDLVGASVLDIGGHIGTFAYAAKARGAAVVHSYEPHPDHYAMLALNANVLRTRAFNTAIGYEMAKGRQPSAGEVSHSRGWSIVPDPAGDVTISGLDTAILRLTANHHRGRVNLLKIDCEGAEWAAFSGAKCLDLVDAIVGEIHRYEWRGKVWDAPDLYELLPGFSIQFGDPAPGATWRLFIATRPS